MKILKKAALLLFAFVFCALFPFSAFAGDYGYEPYYISAYNVEINVTEDNILQITEDIDAYFNEPRHGIYRNIPIRNSVARADGTTGTTRAKISGVRCSENYSSSYVNSDYVMQIGDEDTVITGAHHYRITYDYRLGKDILDGADELYYNIIGSGWDTYIQNVTFKIKMPKKFDESKLGFSLGEYGTIGTDSVVYNVNGNEITGSVGRDLMPYEALTLRLELPDGYFYFNKPLYYAKLTALWAIPLIALAVVLALWSKFGRDKKVVKAVEFYPPEGMSSADVAYWCDGAIDNKKLVPLLIELANEGYVEIIEKDSKHSKFEIRKLKQSYSGSDINKCIFFNGLFKYSGIDVVREDDLKENFYITLAEISKRYNSMKNRTKVFNKKSLFMRITGWMISVISVLLTLFLSALIIGSTEKIIFTAVGVIIGICAFILSFFIRQRTDAGHQILQKIEGFKLFLETAEKERLETLVEDDPKYFYNILPYAYVLGVSDKWISKFEGIAIEPAEWYSSSHPFNNIMFYHFINNTIQSSTRAMTSVPESQSSGGFSGGSGFSGGGGGFSGGGSGGGGGGSW